jgi:hypothetical protein
VREARFSWKEDMEKIQRTANKVEEQRTGRSKPMKNLI